MYGGGEYKIPLQRCVDLRNRQELSTQREKDRSLKWVWNRWLIWGARNRRVWWCLGRGWSCGWSEPPQRCCYGRVSCSSRHWERCGAHGCWKAGHRVLHRPIRRWNWSLLLQLHRELLFLQRVGYPNSHPCFLIFWFGMWIFQLLEVNPELISIPWRYNMIPICLNVWWCYHSQSVYFKSVSTLLFVCSFKSMFGFWMLLPHLVQISNLVLMLAISDLLNDEKSRKFIQLLALVYWWVMVFQVLICSDKSNFEVGFIPHLWVCFSGSLFSIAVGMRCGNC